MPDKITIDISKDKSRAVIMFRPAEGETISLLEIAEALENAGVVHGILTERIQKALDEKTYFRRFTAAVYSPPMMGTNAKIEFLISDEPNIVETPDGRVDYYNLQQFKSVNKGQPVVKKIPATEGVLGTTVTGEEIPASAGQDISLLEFAGGDGVAVDPEDNNQLIALRPGIYFHIGKKVDVRDTLTINQDVDFAVGNIDAPAKLVVNGDVKSGFELKSDRDIEISGVLENAAVETAANLNVMKGIVHGEARIAVKGKLTTNYITERGFIKAGDVEVKNTIIASKVYVEKSVKAHKIVGGKIVVGRVLEVYDLGNINGDATKVEVGIDAIVLTQVRILGREIQEMKKRKQEIMDVLIEEQFNHEDAVEKLESMLFASKYGSSPNLVKKMEERLKETSAKIEELNNEIKEIDKNTKEKMEELEKITPNMAIENPVLIVKGTVFSNVTIKMGMISEVCTKKEGRNLRFELSDIGKIIIKPL